MWVAIDAPRIGARLEEEERRRVLPVIRDLKRRRPNAVVSVDTYKASVARAAVELGAEVVNDVSGFRWDPKMAKTLAELKIGAVLMHTADAPEEWPALPPIGDPVLMVKRDLRQWAETRPWPASSATTSYSTPDLDSGSVSRKTIRCSRTSRNCSRWDFRACRSLTKIVCRRMLASDGKDAEVAQRLYGTLAAETALILKGTHIIRTHDVRVALEAAKVADAIVASGG